VLYREGKGVARDPQRGYFWTRVAALQGDDVAQAALPAAAGGLSREQVNQADARAVEWMKQNWKALSK
jgi:TPR repeat protein